MYSENSQQDVEDEISMLEQQSRSTQDQISSLMAYKTTIHQSIERAKNKRSLLPVLEQDISAEQAEYAELVDSIDYDGKNSELIAAWAKKQAVPLRHGGNWRIDKVKDKMVVSFQLLNPVVVDDAYIQNVYLLAKTMQSGGDTVMLRLPDNLRGHGSIIVSEEDPAYVQVSGSYSSSKSDIKTLRQTLIDIVKTEDEHKAFMKAASPSYDY